MYKLINSSSNENRKSQGGSTLKKGRKQKTKTSLGQDSDPRGKTLPVVHKTFMSEGVKNLSFKGKCTALWRLKLT